MKATLLLSVVFVLRFMLLANCLNAQTIPTFCLELSSSQDDRNEGGTPTYDGNYIVTGITGTNSGKNYFIAKCDEQGNILWYQESGSFLLEYYGHVIETSDHSIVAIGNNGIEMVIVKFSEAGVELWRKKIDVMSGNFLEDIFETSDGNYLLAGRTEDSFGFRYTAVIKISPAGDLVWEKYFYNPYRTTLTYACLETEGSRYSIAGHSNGAASYFFIINLDEDGNLQWSKKSLINGVVYDLVATADSGMVGVGYLCPGSGTLCNPMMTKLNADGQTEWSYIYGDSLFGRFYAAVQFPDGSIAAAGDATDQVSIFHGFAAKVDTNGQMQWGKITDDYEFKSIGASTDGGIIVSSNTIDDKFGIMKMDINGNSCPECLTTDYAQQDTGAGMVNETFSEYLVSAIVSDLTLSEIPFTPLVSVHCSGVGLEEEQISDVMVFQNPFIEEYFECIVPEHLIGNRYCIYDWQGRKIMEETIHSLKVNIEFKNHPAGIYFLQLNGGFENNAVKLVKLR